MFRDVERVARGVVVGATRVLLGRVETAWADPHHELRQSIWITPFADRVSIEVELYPGLLVAEEFVAALDADGDGMISEDEALAYVRGLVGSSMHARFGASEVTLRLERVRCAPFEALRASDGTLVFELSADAPSTDGVREVAVSYSHAPAHSTVQLSVTLPLEEPVLVEQIDRTADGSTLTVRYMPRVAVAS